MTGPLVAPPSLLRRPALFLDLDGVLAPLAPTPDAVVPDERRTAVLRSVSARFEGRVAIVSGRTLAEVDRISEGVLPAASGVHGLERRRADGTLTTGAVDPAVGPVVDAFRTFAADRPGMIVEDKTVAAGLHFRGAQDQAGAATDLAERLADETGLILQPGNLVVELKTPGTDKGTALTAFMAELPFQGAVPVMLGDDLTDEHGFQAAEALGGFGVLVGPERITSARYRLSDVAAVLDWLETVSEAPE
ncbi:trehalose-phosphatase [uncultured Brevundimonas sp.]|uniref:trehalose-phosphatase n=1 Tax=uncultured Brevundimonas sp. TaxID=213418 RepID=UPI0030EBEF70